MPASTEVRIVVVRRSMSTVRSFKITWESRWRSSSKICPWKRFFYETRNVSDWSVPEWKVWFGFALRWSTWEFIFSCQSGHRRNDHVSRFSRRSAQRLVVVSSRRNQKRSVGWHRRKRRGRNSSIGSLRCRFFRFRKTIVCPIIDVLTYDAFQLLHGATDIFGTFSWKMIFRWTKIEDLAVENQAQPIRSVCLCVNVPGPTKFVVELRPWLEVSMPSTDFTSKSWECTTKESRFGAARICKYPSMIDLICTRRRNVELRRCRVELLNWIEF